MFKLQGDSYIQPTERERVEIQLDGGGVAVSPPVSLWVLVSSEQQDLVV